MIRNRYNYITSSVQERERRTHLKQRHHNQNTTSRKPKGQFLTQTIGQNGVSKIKVSYMQRHIMTELVNHGRSTALEWSVKPLLGICVFCTCEIKVREKSRECHNHKPQPFPDPKRKRKPTNLNKHKPNKHTKSTNISSLFPKRGNRNTKRPEKNPRTK